MFKVNLDDTIAAIATPIGEGGIGIVRLSGKDALPIVDRIFVSKDGKKPSQYETYTTHYGWIVSNNCHCRESGNPKTRIMDARFPRFRGDGHDSYDEVIDEVILTVMKAPKSYTKEDVVEINCHGGIVPLKKVLELVLSLGARLAEPGEFTKRAFLNGRIDLTQAEAVLDIIRAKTEKGLKAALLQLEGGMSEIIKGFRERLLDIKVNIEASVDFPDEELPTSSVEALGEELGLVKTGLKKFLDTFEAGKIIREGITCVICGKANVGKSSLMNELLKEERVIVTPVPGTTRDAVSEYINVEGIPINIVDTAGISPISDPLAREAIRRSRLWIDKADLILFMLDAVTGFLDEDRYIIELIKDKEIICVVNKIDVEGRMNINYDELKRYFGKDFSLIEISVLKKTNLDILLRSILDKVWRGEVFTNDFDILTNARHREAIFKALKAVEEAISSLKGNQPEEIIAISLNEAIYALGEVTGVAGSEEVLERIFSQFCVGK